MGHLIKVIDYLVIGYCILTWLNYIIRYVAFSNYYFMRMRDKCKPSICMYFWKSNQGRFMARESGDGGIARQQL